MLCQPRTHNVFGEQVIRQKKETHVKQRTEWICMTLQVSCRTACEVLGKALRSLWTWRVPKGWDAIPSKTWLDHVEEYTKYRSGALWGNGHASRESPMGRGGIYGVYGLGFRLLIGSWLLWLEKHKEWWSGFVTKKCQARPDSHWPTACATAWKAISSKEFMNQPTTFSQSWNTMTEQVLLPSHRLQHFLG